MKKIEAIISPAKLDAASAQLQRSGIHSALIVTQVEQINGSGWGRENALSRHSAV